MSATRDRLSWNEYQQQGCAATLSEDGTELAATFAPAGGRVSFQGPIGQAGGAAWNAERWLCFDIEAQVDWSVLLNLDFWTDGHATDDAPDMSISTGILPRLKTRIALPLQLFDSQKWFIARTPGRRKTGVRSNAADPSQVSAFGISMPACFGRQTVTISDLCLLDEEPDYPLPDVKMVDELGQLATRDWPGKTYGVGQLVADLTAESQEAPAERPSYWSAYGGWKAKRFEATGWFRTEHDGQRWWLVDPDGYAFFSQGLDQVQPGQPHFVHGIQSLYECLPEEPEYAPFWSKSKGMVGSWHFVGQLSGEEPFFCFPEANLYRAFGDKWWETWANMTINRHTQWRLNTIGNWSQLKFIQHAKMPYVWPLVDFPTTQVKVFRDFPDVFADEYQQNADQFAQQLKPFVDDKYLIGYFLRNEPNWAFLRGLNIAEEVLASPRPLACRAALIAFLQERYQGDIAALASAWQSSLTSWDDLARPIAHATSLSATANQDLRDFSTIMVRRYVALPSEACRAIDPNHMNLGMRWAYVHDPVLVSGHEYFDVFSINSYQRTPAEQIQSVGELTGKPVLVGEFHFGALDRGMTSTGLRGVTSQSERGVAWRYYVETSAANPYCVGVHYFILNDQPVLGRLDGENYQIGLVDVCQRPYAEFVREIKSTSETIYQVAAGSLPPIEVMAEETGRVG